MCVPQSFLWSHQSNFLPANSHNHEWSTLQRTEKMPINIGSVDPKLKSMSSVSHGRYLYHIPQPLTEGPSVTVPRHNEQMAQPKPFPSILSIVYHNLECTDRYQCPVYHRIISYWSACIYRYVCTEASDISRLQSLSSECTSRATLNGRGNSISPSNL